MYRVTRKFIIRPFPQRCRSLRPPLSARLRFCFLLTVLCAFQVRAADPWNSPYPSEDSGRAILYGSFAERPKHLDPASSYSENEAIFTAQIYEPVVQYHYLERPYRLIPLTAESVPSAEYYDSAGRRLPDDAPREHVAEAVYRITLRQGIRFQPHPAFATEAGGAYTYHALTSADLSERNVLNDFSELGTRELTAEDYVYQIKRLVRPGLHSPVAGLMGKYIKGLDELGRRLQQAAADDSEYLDLRDFDFEGARSLDRYTYEIRITEKYPQFRFWLAMPFFAPVPWEADVFYAQPGMREKNISLDWYPVGTGPYLLTENNPNRRMTLQRNPNFRGEQYPSSGAPGDAAVGLLASAGRTMPFIETAYYSLEKENIPEWTKFLQGYYDVSSILAESFDQAIRFNSQGEAGLTDGMREKGIQLQTATMATISYLGFNMRDPVVGGDGEKARLLRRAIAIAMDFEELISIFANGRGVPAQGPIPPGIFGHVEGERGLNPYVYEWRAGRAQRRSIEEARLLMRDAGFPNGRDPVSGKPLTLYFETASGGPGSKALLNWYRKQFEKLGIQLVIRATDYNRFQEKVRKGTAQIFGWGWNADYPDPENFLFLLYGPNGKVEHHGENAVNYRNARFDELFVRMRALEDTPERQALIDEMVEILRRDGPWVWGFHPTAYTLRHAWFGNSKPNLMARNTLKYKTIDAPARVAARREWNRPVFWPLLVLAGVLCASAVPAWRTYRARQDSAAR